MSGLVCVSRLASQLFLSQGQTTLEGFVTTAYCSGQRKEVTAKGSGTSFKVCL